MDSKANPITPDCVDDHFKVDTTDDNNVWVVLRRVNFYTGDLILRETEPIGVGVVERRLLDALGYAEESGRDWVGTSVLCAIVQAPMKHSTALSTLQRMTDQSWVVAQPKSDGSKRQNWQLTDSGRKVRSLYGQIAEQVIERLYADAGDELRDALFDIGRSALAFMNDRVIPILDYIGQTRATELTTANWQALRSVHFYLSDLIVRETAPMGVGMNDRRVMDALGFARHRDIQGGLNVATICKLNAVLTRQIVLSVLDRASERGWVVKIESTKGRPRWDLTEKGASVREIYKRYAQLKLCEVYGRQWGEENGEAFLHLAQVAQSYRDARLEPVVASIRTADKLEPA